MRCYLVLVITLLTLDGCCYQCLQQPLADSEWGLLVSSGDRKRRETLIKAMDRRLDANKKSNDKGLKRIDWLGEAVCI
jgi:hypothetical protein